MVVNQLGAYYATTPNCVVGEWILNGTIEGVNVTTDGRLGLGVSAPVQALEAAGSAVVAGTLSAGNPLMFRNALYNGGMAVNQRGISTNWASPTAMAVPASGIGYSLDRQNHTRGGLSGGGAYAQGTLAVTDAPYSQGLQYYLRIGRQTGDTSTQFISWAQMLESRESYRFAGGAITYSCWYRTGVGYSGTGFTPTIIYGTGIDQNGITSSFANQVTLTGPTYPNSNAWQRATFTTFIGQTASQVGVYALYIPVGTAGGFDYFDVTGVQLEKGSVATTWEQRPYATELALCYRYYYRRANESLYDRIGTWSADSSTVGYTQIPLPVRMRAIPTPNLSAYSDFAFNNGTPSAWGPDTNDQSSIMGIVKIVGTGFTNNTIMYAITTNGKTVGTAYFEFNAEI
jgi:hypothetical protein